MRRVVGNLLLQWGLGTLFLLYLGTGCGGDTSSSSSKAFLLADGQSLGTFTRTLYILSYEKDFSGAMAQAPGSSGASLGDFPEEYIDELCLAGSGITADGRLLSLYWGACGGQVFNSNWCHDRCFEFLDVAKHPFSSGASGAGLKPFRSAAVDKSLIALHTKLFLPRWVGLRLPNGAVHDGCWVAQDTGGGVKGNKIDLFVGIGHKVLDLVVPITGGYLQEEVFVDPPGCPDQPEALMSKEYFLEAYEPGWTPEDHLETGPPEQPENPESDDPLPIGEDMGPQLPQPPSGVGLEVHPSEVPPAEVPIASETPSEPVVFGSRQALPEPAPVQDEGGITATGGCGLLQVGGTGGYVEPFPWWYLGLCFYVCVRRRS